MPNRQKKAYLVAEIYTHHSHQRKRKMILWAYVVDTGSASAIRNIFCQAAQNYPELARPFDLAYSTLVRRGKIKLTMSRVPEMDGLPRGIYGGLARSCYNAYHAIGSFIHNPYTANDKVIPGYFLFTSTQEKQDFVETQDFDAMRGMAQRNTGHDKDHPRVDVLWGNDCYAIRFDGTTGQKMPQDDVCSCPTVEPGANVPPPDCVPARPERQISRIWLWLWLAILVLGIIWLAATYDA